MRFLYDLFMLKNWNDKISLQNKNHINYDILT